MANKITIKIEKYEPGTTFMADTNPVVNDEDYVDVITTSPRIHYTYDGVQCSMYGNKTDNLNDLIPKVKEQVAWDVWFEENQDKTFSEIGEEAPSVYDYEEDEWYSLDGISNYVYNCKFEDDYEKIINKLRNIAKQTIDITIENNID